MNRNRKIGIGVFTAALISTALIFQNCSSDLRTPAKAYEDYALPERISAVLTSEPQLAAAPYADWTQATLELTTYGSYSPASYVSDKVFVGGWMSSADPIDYLSALDRGANPQNILGPDKIFLADKKDTPEATLASVRRVLALPGYHINDPTFIKPQSTDGVDRSTWIYMYFTMLDNRLAENCRRSKKPLIQCSELFEGHDIGMASSTDEGETWTYRGKVVPATGAGDGRGAWMPSVLQVGNEIHLYYETGSQTFTTPNLYRLRLNANGLTPLGAHEAISISGFQAGQLYANVDVKMAVIGGNTRFFMVANSGNQKQIVGLYSANGLAFTPLTKPLYTSTDATALVSPYLNNFGENSLSGVGGSGGGSAGVFIHLSVMAARGPTTWELRQQTVFLPAF